MPFMESPRCPGSVMKGLGGELVTRPHFPYDCTVRNKRRGIRNVAGVAECNFKLVERKRGDVRRILEIPKQVHLPTMREEKRVSTHLKRANIREIRQRLFTNRNQAALSLPGLRIYGNAPGISAAVAHTPATQRKKRSDKPAITKKKTNEKSSSITLLPRTTRPP